MSVKFWQLFIFPANQVGYHGASVVHTSTLQTCTRRRTYG